MDSTLAEIRRCIDGHNASHDPVRRAMYASKALWLMESILPSLEADNKEGK